MGPFILIDPRLPSTPHFSHLMGLGCGIIRLEMLLQFRANKDANREGSHLLCVVVGSR
jgi:hypothetical protein